ncbi:MAG TPA: adenylate/guanylate cyclase domain-containing protein [Candidatus Acidoferrales bacterium]|nr:adenylate/guanylate cyclase domain-containing protein [Candidatus Acidoferrales bacterium]
MPRTQFARSGRYNIAYQIVGDGPFDLLWVPGFVSNVELSWEEPLLARFLQRLASFSRLILFDKRGTGMSDRVPLDELPTLEERMEDLVAVLDAAGSQRAALVSHSEGGNLAILFAATYPQRTIALVTLGVFAKRVWSADYPWAPRWSERAAEIEAMERDWGVDSGVAKIAPSAARDEAFSRRLATYFRRSASPGAAAAVMRMNTEIDIRHILPTIGTPTLVVHRTNDLDARIEEGRWIAAQIPGARFLELPGEDHLPWVGDQDAILDPVEEFLTGSPPALAAERVLATVLFIDIVGSTTLAAEMGDRRWRSLLEQFFAMARQELERYRGREVHSTGDGLLAVFDGPARAVRCGQAIRDVVRGLGLEMRAGVHTGEVEVGPDDIQGIAVHIGARVAAAAEAGEVWTSSVVRDLTPGSGLMFEDRGLHRLKGVPDEWRLFSVVAKA